MHYTATPYGLLIKRIFFFVLLLNFWVPVSAKEKAETYPKTKIANQYVTMKLYLPDSANGYYRGTRFDWSGVVYSLEYQGHQYFGEWNSGTDSRVHQHITGPVESFGGKGTGYEESAVGEGFLRMGVGLLEKEEDAPYKWNHTYKIIDHGEWIINQGSDWIEFKHEVTSKTGWAYRYIKRIALTKDKPGFVISHRLENTGVKKIETNQFNHNFFVIDGTTTGPDYTVEFPFQIISAEGDDKSKKLVKISNNKLHFNKYFKDEAAWLNFSGFNHKVSNHQFKIVNHKTGVGVELKVDKPLCRMVFWANQKTLCPENFVCINIAPGESETWDAEYSLFIEN